MLQRMNELLKIINEQNALINDLTATVNVMLEYKNKYDELLLKLLNEEQKNEKN